MRLPKILVLGEGVFGRLWDSLMFGRLAMGFANVRAGSRVLMLVLVQAVACFDYIDPDLGSLLSQASTRILGRRTAPYPPSLITQRVPHGLTPRS